MSADRDRATVGSQATFASVRLFSVAHVAQSVRAAERLRHIAIRPDIVISPHRLPFGATDLIRDNRELSRHRDSLRIRDNDHLRREPVAPMENLTDDRFSVRIVLLLCDTETTICAVILFHDTCPYRERERRSPCGGHCSNVVTAAPRRSGTDQAADFFPVGAGSSISEIS